MKRQWLLFSQVVTVLVAIWFVVVTLKPEWLNLRATAVNGVTLIEAAPNVSGAPMPGSFSPAAKLACMVAMLTTAGDLVFGGSVDGYFYALDAVSGRGLWHIAVGAQVRAAPMTFAVDGQHYVTIAAGNVIYTFGLDED